MFTCSLCNQNPAAEILKICSRCLKDYTQTKDLLTPHHSMRTYYSLPLQPPKHKKGVICKNCSNTCELAPGKTGYCGVRTNEGGEIKIITQPQNILASYYFDPLPTNCCASWFCRGSCKKGYNLAVFFYGCSFDCLFCQNASHKHIARAQSTSIQDLLQIAIKSEVRCVCFFGGSPEPQLELALQFSEKLITQSGNTKHICWEWNGSGNPSMVRKAVEISARSGGTVKFDLKAFTPQLALALCGVDNKRSMANFKLIAEEYKTENMLTATTLLVPYYVDEDEVDNIAHYIAEQNETIPYSLLVFHSEL